MTISTEEFISTFHSLSGTTIGERRKNLFLFMGKIQDSQNLNFSSIQPKTKLEESFHVEVLIYFKRVPEMIEVLKSENPILIEKVLKASSWFLEQALERISGEDLVKCVFPSLSFNAKVKLLHKLALYLKNAEQADAIYNAVKEKYGYYLASKLLPCCSEKTIMECIKTSRIEVTPRHLLTIVKKHPHIIEPVLAALSEFQGKALLQCKYQNIFKHVLKTDVLLFLKLRQIFKPGFQFRALGWRATERLVDRNKADFLKNADVLYNLLNKKQIVKSVSNDFREFYLHLLPKSLNRFKNDYNFYLEVLPSNVDKMDVLLTTYKKKYGHDLLDDPQCITPGLLELMTPDEREVWMKTHERPKDFIEDLWICLMKTDKSIPALKQRISLISDIEERAQLVGCLAETCRINNDKVALLEACKYVIMQHRNDDNAVVLCFLRTLKKCFCLDTLEDEHWKYINEMVHLFIVRGMIPYHYHSWLYDYIQYRLSKKLSIIKELKELSSKIHVSSNLCNSAVSQPYQKEYMIRLLEVMPDIIPAEELESHSLQFLSNVLTWNKKNRNDQIPLPMYKGLLTTALESNKKEDGYEYSYVLDSIITSYIHTGIEEDEINTVLEAFFRRKNITFQMNAMEWLIKCRPLIVCRHIDSIVNNILDLWYTLIKPFFWQHSGKYHHLQIPQKIILICLAIINNKEETDSRKKNAITALSYLMQPEEFINFVEPYYPSDLVMDVNSEENQETYKIQQAITASLKNVIPPSRSLQSVLNFSKGDYLKFIQRSLYSVSHSVAEEKLPFLFLSLTDRAVSVRKHAIYLTFKVLDRIEIHKMLTKFMETEKNSSIRKFLFKGTFHYFAKNSDDCLWELVKQNVRSVDINDEEAFTTLMEIKKVPSGYLSRYLMFTWELLETLPNPQNVENEKCKLLDAVNSTVIPCLTTQFCVEIIQKYLFKSKEVTNLQNRIHSFTCQFVVFSHSESDQQERLKFVFEILKAFVNTTWYKPDTKTMGRNLVFYFLKGFCSFVIENPSLSTNIFSKFVELWKAFLNPHDAFEEYLHLQFTLIYVDFVNNNLSLIQVGQQLANLCDSLLGVYGNAVANTFCLCLKSEISNFLNGTNDDGDSEANRFVLIESIISASNSANCFIIAVSLLPEDAPVNLNLKLLYNRIMSLLENNSDVVVQLALSLYFSSIANRRSIDIPDVDRFKRKSGSYGGCFRSIVEYDSKYKK